jgi:alpha-glucoside transport system substrate-binding protein
MARAARCLLALSLCAAGAGCAAAPRDDTVTILVPWSGAEYEAFLSVVRPFERQSGVQVFVESSRALTQQLTADLAAPPDLVDLPSPAAADQYKKQLRPLTVNLGSYDQPWQGLAELGTGRVYVVPVKVDVKSLIWSKAAQAPPETWAALESLSRQGSPWCLGLASGPTSGWPGADWVADILLSAYGAKAYEAWLDGEPRLGWTSADVEYAWSTWGDLMRKDAGIYGGAEMALNTGFGDAKKEIASGQCEFQFGALSATGLTSAAGYTYVPFPSISGAPSPVLVSGDFMGLLTANPNARKLLAYLASRRAQALWVRQPGAFAFSADQAVTPAAYPAGVQRQIARLLRPGDGSTLCFSAEDMMQSDMTAAFEQAVLAYINNPASLPALLKGLQTTQQGAVPTSRALVERACDQP